MTFASNMMGDYPPSLAAAKQLAPLAEGFVFFSFEWLGRHPDDWHVMRCDGAVLREAKSGPRKGQRVIPVRGTERSAYITREEIAQAEAQRLKQDLKAEPDAPRP